MLEIPHLNKVPRTFRLPGSRIASARTALALVDYVGLDGYNPPALKPGIVIETLLDRWLQKHVGTMKHMRIRLSYDEGSADPAQDTEAAITLAVDMGRSLRIGTKLEALQQFIPGLGETVLWHLQHDMPPPVEIVTPALTLEFAQWIHWGGCDDEQETVQNLIDEGEKRKDIHILTRAQLDAQFPPWSIDPTERQKPEALANMAKHWKKPRRVRDIAQAVLDLHEVRHEWEGREDGMRCWPPAQILHWKAGDNITEPLCDDMNNMFWESGEAIEDFTEIHLHRDEDWSQTLPQWMAGVEAKLRTLRAADRLLQLIGTPVHG